MASPRAAAVCARAVGPRPAARAATQTAVVAARMPRARAEVVEKGRVGRDRGWSMAGRSGKKTDMVPQCALLRVSPVLDAAVRRPVHPGGCQQDRLRSAREDATTGNSNMPLRMRDARNISTPSKKDARDVKL